MRSLIERWRGGRWRDVRCRCVFCDRPSTEERICSLCAALLPWNDRFCERCGQPVLAAQPARVPCADCQRRPPPYVVARAPLVYAFPVDAALLAIKFRRQLWYAPAFGVLLGRCIEAELAAADALVPVPLHRWRYMRRGFNQAEELCAIPGRKSALPVVTNVRRIGATAPQLGLSATARRKNLAGAFAVAGALDCRRPLIVDDVITTGETSAQLARTLLDAGAESVRVLAVARAGAAIPTAAKTCSAARCR